MAHYLRSANQLADTFFILPTWNIGYPVYKDTGDLTVGVLDSKSRGPGLDGLLCLSADVIYCTKAEECLITGYFWERFIY